MREIVRQHFRFFLFAILAALALRLLFVLRFPAITSDSLVYGDIAKNWLHYRIYGLSGIHDVSPTYIRLPGYPAFLAAVFAIFGVEHYHAAIFLQMFVDLGTCFLIADMARRLISPAAARAAFVLAGLCPFLANYAAAALTETWEIFFTALALDLALAALDRAQARTFRIWLGCGLATGAAMLLRPDGALLLIALEVYLGISWLRLLVAKSEKPGPGLPSIARPIKTGLVVALVALATLIPWTLRNLRTLHQFQPLAPRYANEENSFVPTGFNRWIKTWIANYASVEEVYWAVPGATVDADNLPSRAFDSEEQRNQTEGLLDDYNHSLSVTPEMDARFATLATDRIHHAPLRYYVGLPLLRLADMWLRPRTEILPSNTRWWEFDEEPKWLALGIAVGVIGILYVGLALIGLWRGHFGPHLGLLLAFVIVRSAFLATLENPEPRYTLECYPVVILLASAFVARWFHKSN